MDNESFEALFNESVKNDRTLNKIETGKVLRITSKGEVFVDLGYKADGIIPRNEFSENGELDPNTEFKVGDDITVQVLKLNDGVGNVLLSYKKIRSENIKKQKEASRQEAIKEKKQAEENFWNSINVGDEYEGKVRTITSYGAFVDFGYGSGLLHVSEITWKRNVNVEDYLKVGEEVKVFVKSVDKDTKKIQLGYKNRELSPWETVSGKYNVGDLVKGKVVKFAKFGAFVEVETGIEGLVHISEISDERVLKPEDKLNIGEEVDVKILNIDTENRKLSLSIKAVHENDWKNDIQNIKGVTFEG